MLKGKKEGRVLTGHKNIRYEFYINLNAMQHLATKA